jgi:Zn-dependent protease
MLTTIILGLVWIVSVLLAITVHEMSHAWMADRLGDPTARLSGRLSLNPLKHYDPIGTTLLFVTSFLLFFGAPVIPFGWAKPVMYDPYNLKNPQRDAALISLAGPASNILISIIFAIILRFTLNPFSPVFIISRLLELFISINVSLAIFNLLPIHPLDGGKILIGLLPEKEGHELDLFLNRYGFFLLIFLILPIINGNSILSSVISPVINLILKLFIPS